MRIMHILLGASMTLAISAIGSTASAQDLVYEPVNPSFGGNPFNSAHLLAIANTQNDFEPPERDNTQSDLDRFVRSLQSRLLSSLSTQVSNSIFGEDAQDSGTIVFGDQTISFVRGLDGIELTITEADGSTTVITVPILQVEDDTADDGEENPDSSQGKTPYLPNSTVSFDQLLTSAKTAQQPSLLKPLSTSPIQQPIQ